MFFDDDDTMSAGSAASGGSGNGDDMPDTDAPQDESEDVPEGEENI